MPKYEDSWWIEFFLKGVGSIFLHLRFKGSQVIIWGPFIQKFKSPGTIVTLESPINTRGSSEMIAKYADFWSIEFFLRELGLFFFNSHLKGTPFIIWDPYLQKFKSPGTIGTLESPIIALG